MDSEKTHTGVIDQDMLARMERFATHFPQDLQRLEKESHKISENIPKITLEIEEFKKIKDSFMPLLVKAVKQSLKEEMQEISEGMVQGFKNQIGCIVDDYGQKAADVHHQYFEKAAAFKQEMESTVSVFQKLLFLQKQRLTRKGLLICGVFCLSSFLTGLGLFYFFPQHVYNPDHNTAKYIELGKAAWKSFPRLSPKDQDLLTEEVKKQMMRK